MTDSQQVKGGDVSDAASAGIHVASRRLQRTPPRRSTAALPLPADRSRHLQITPEGQKLLCEERTVASENNDTYVFGYRAVQDKAPNVSGVYTIYTSQRWLYVGESEDVKQSLFQHLSELSKCLARRGPLSFSFEVVPAADRAGRQQALVRALAPTCQS